MNKPTVNPHGDMLALQPRPRLFQQMDVMPDAVIWLAAAGGYGKTTLAQLYAHHRSLPVLLLNIPEQGLTTGAFFFTMREAAQTALGEGAGTLPLLSPEYVGGTENFTKHFLAALRHLLLQPVLLLIDNLHHLPAIDPLHEILQRLSGVMLEAGHRVVITSRHEPVAGWNTWLSREHLLLLDERVLAFDQDEVQALLRIRSYHPAEKDLSDLSHQLHRYSRGWVAALILILEHWRRTGLLPLGEQLDGTLEGWFAHEVFAPLTTLQQGLLCSCAVPAIVPADLVNQVCERDDALQMLDALRQQHAFIQLQNIADGRRCYRIHDLFRAFLQGQAGDTLAEHQIRWGMALWQRGDWSDAVPLLLAAKAYDRLGPMLAQQGMVLLQTGYGEDLYRWLQALPAKQRERDPYLTLWEGMCLILHNTADARLLLCRAWKILCERQDYPHMAMAWTGIVDSIWLEWAHVSEYEPWIRAFERHHQAFRQHLPPALWYAVLRGILAATSYARPNDPQLIEWEREALATLAGDMPASECLMLAGQLMYLNTWQLGRRAGAARVMAIMQGKSRARDEASPLARCVWQTFSALWSLLFDGDKRACLQQAAAGRELIREYGISTWDNAVPPMHAALCFADSTAMDDWMEWFHRTECRANRPFYDTFQAHFMAGSAWLKGDLHEAIAHAEHSLYSAERHGSVVIQAGFQACLAGIQAEAGDHRGALRSAAAARRHARAIESDFLEVMVHFPLARIGLLRGQSTRSLPYLRRAFEAGARQRLFFPVMVRSGELLEMCELARQHGIQPGYADWLQQVVLKNLDDAPLVVLRSLCRFPLMSREMIVARTGNEGLQAMESLAVVMALVVIEEERRQRWYRIHPILREYLLVQSAVPLLEGAECEGLAEALQRDGAGAAAVGLLQENGLFNQAVRLFLVEAPTLMMAGRQRDLCVLLKGFDPQLDAQHPWLAYWRALCQIAASPLAARTQLQSLGRHFAQIGDHIGMASCWAGQLATIWQAWGDCTALSPLLADAPLRPDDPAWPMLPPPLQDRVAIHALLAHLMHCPSACDSQIWRTWLTMQLARGDGFERQLMIGHALLIDALWGSGDGELAGSLFERLDSIYRQNQVSPQIALLWQTAAAGYGFWHQSGSGPCFARVHEALRLASRTANPGWRLQVAALGAYTALFDELPDQATQYIATAHTHHQHDSVADTGMQHFLLGWQAMGQQEDARALMHLREADRLNQQGRIVQGMVFSGVALACVADQAGDRPLAMQAMARVRAVLGQCGSDLHRCVFLMGAAWLSLRRGQPRRSRVLLGYGLALMRRHELRRLPGFTASQLVLLCNSALAEGVETAFAQAFLQRYPARSAVASPRDDVDIRIRAFGGLVVTQGDTELRLSARSRDILKVLLSENGDVAFSQLCDVIWPDAEGDAARRAADTALHRLRKQLGPSDFLVLQDGRLRIDTAHCWVDVLAMQHHLQVLATQQGLAQRLHLEAIATLYRGELLNGEQSPHTLMPTRALFQRKYVRAMLKLLDLLVQAGETARVGALLEWVLEIAPGEQALHQWREEYYRQNGVTE